MVLWQKMSIPRIRFTRIGNDETLDWSTVKAVRFRYTAIPGATGVADFDTLQVTAGADGNALTGVFRVRYKFVFEDGTFTDESLPSPTSDKVGLSAEAIQIQIPQASAIAMDPQTTAIWPYIWSASMGAYYRTINPLSMNRAKKTLFEWGAFIPDGVISSDDRLRILTIGRCYGRRYTPGTDPIYIVTTPGDSTPIPTTSTAETSSVGAVVGSAPTSGPTTGAGGGLIYWDFVLNQDSYVLFNVDPLQGSPTSVTSVTVNASIRDPRGQNPFRYGFIIGSGGAILYNTGVLTVDASDQGFHAVTITWTNNPITSLPFTVAERNSYQFGIYFPYVGSDSAENNVLNLTDSYVLPGGASSTVTAKNVLTFNIQTSESALLQRNERLDTGREAPPDDIIAIIGSHFTRTLCLSNDYLYISDPGKPSLYPIFQSIKVSDGINERNLWMYKASGSVYIGTTKDIYRLNGSLVEFPNGTLDATLIAMNIGSPPIDSAVAFEGNSLVYRASDGPRILIGEQSQPLRGDLNLLLLGQDRHGVPAIDNGSGRHRLAMSNGYLYWAVPPQTTEERRVTIGEWLIPPDGEISASDRRRILTVGRGSVQEGSILRYHFPTQRWSRRPYSRVFRSLTRGLQGQVYGGTGASEVVKLETGTQDNGRDIPVTILTTQQDDAAPLSRKVPFDLSIRMDTGGNTAIIGVYLDGADTPSLTFEASTTGQQIYKKTISSLAHFRRIQLKFEGEFSTFKLYDWNVSFRPMPQHHYYLDTGNVDVGNEYQWYREITLLVKSDNDLNVDVYFDDVLLSSNTVTVTPGVSTQYQIPLGRAIRGRQPRVVISTTADPSANEDGFECYWVQWKVRESGNVSQKKIIKWSSVTK